MEKRAFTKIAIDNTQSVCDYLSDKCNKLDELARINNLGEAFQKKLQVLDEATKYFYFYIDIFSDRSSTRPINIESVCRDFFKDFNSDKNKKKRHNQKRKLKKNGIEGVESQSRKLITNKKDIEGPVIINNYSAIIQTVIIQVLRNSVKYCLAGQDITLDIEKTTDNETLLRFTNYGPNLTNEEVAQIWMKGWRGQTATKLDVEGEGIGLFLIDEISKALVFYRGAYIDHDERKKLTINGIDYFPFTVYLKFPHRETEQSVYDEIGIKEDYSLYYHEVIQAIKRYSRKTTDIKNWIKSNPDKDTDNVILIIQECEHRMRRLEMQLHYMSYIYSGNLPKMIKSDERFYSMDLLYQLILDYNNNSIEIDYEQQLKPAVFLGNKQFINIVLEEIVCFAIAHRRDSREILRVEINNSDISLKIITEDDFQPYNKSILPAFSDMDIGTYEAYKWLFLKNMLNKTIEKSIIVDSHNHIDIYLTNN